MHNLILTRHGQSLWNKEKRFTGWADIDLTEKGKLEAELAGKLIKELNIEIDAYFTSIQKRAVNTLKIILDILNKKDSKITKAWEFNERHYGNLTGLNKDEMLKIHGEKQIQIWRRSFSTPPPPMNPRHPYKKNTFYTNIPKDKVPQSESLKDTFERVIPYYQKKIMPLISLKKNILISAHGNSLRALCKKLFNISEKNIINFEIPTGNPLLIQFENNLEIKNYKYLDNKRAKKILFNI
jgi:2,3-bisphosphoglycerate-dependent phosphoglycerate mutase